MIHTPTISVIVPAYNAEKYLDRCLNSIAVQTMQDFEVIIIDDGSTDSTGQIADRIATKDPRFKVIHQPNNGVAAARQKGLDSAQGEFSIHIDSDDWIDEDLFESLIKEAREKDADIVICDIKIIHADGFIELRSQKPSNFDPTTVLGEMFFELYASLCNKIIRHSLYSEYGIRFIPGMNYSEDQYTVFRLLSHGPKVAYVNNSFYYYDHTQNESSICNRGVLAADRLKPLEMIADYTDISLVQDYFDKAVFHIAFEYLYEPRELCPDYVTVFRTHRPTFWRVKGYSFRAKLFVLLRAYGIYLPMNEIKSFWKRLLKRG